MIPPSVRVGIALVSPVVCGHCGPVEVVPDEERERPRICHPFADCPDVLWPDSAGALAFAMSVDEGIGRYAVRADYGDDIPVHAFGYAL